MISNGALFHARLLKIPRFNRGAVMAQSLTAGSASMPTIVLIIAVAFFVGFYFLNPEGFHHMLDWIARQSNHLMR